MGNIRRVYSEKKTGFDVDAERLFTTFKDQLGIKGLTKVRVLIRYDVEGVAENVFKTACTTIFSEPPADFYYLENLPAEEEDTIIAVEYLPGQYDQRADSAAQCIQLLTEDQPPLVKTAVIYLLSGSICPKERTAAAGFLINPVDSREASLKKPKSLSFHSDIPETVETVEGFTSWDPEVLEQFRIKKGLAMNADDLLHCQKYFLSESRNPTITELKLLDTYWSDHCRHTTFLTRLETVEIEESPWNESLKQDWEDFLKGRKKETPACLMDLALAAMKELRAEGMLNDLEVSREINACSIVVEAEIDGKPEEWLVMFKNETHNHPTEIEPFGGAATCLGGAIRDPLSGRSYVYQAMRVTGAADPRLPLEKTLPGKLPQRKITTEAAHGYSSYGNQIGIATGLVDEIYHPGYLAKRMEIGAVIAAAPRRNVFRGTPEEGDLVILVGGRTGRDGCGGATGSSKKHTAESILVSGAEVQKGNPPTERKIQRFFRNSEVSRRIKVCNDFGAGGVSVAIGEIADSLQIDLDAVPLKYDGLDGTELAISESQERMAVLVSPQDEAFFIEEAKKENLEAVRVARVTADNRVQMVWKNNKIVNLDRSFIDTNGVLQSVEVKIQPPENTNWFEKTAISRRTNQTWPENWKKQLSDLNICSKQGLIEMFDSTIGAGSVFHPMGGKLQRTPEQVMAAKLPVLEGETTTATVMSYGYNPFLSEWSPYHGALFAVIESVSKLVCAGADFSKIRLTFQEYFERLEKSPEKWGKPTAALLGAYRIQKELGIAAIGGKDSMSGTFEKITVPPTLVSFAVSTETVDQLISTEWKETGNSLIWLKFPLSEQALPNYEALRSIYKIVYEGIKRKDIVSAREISFGGLAEALVKSAFGNHLGIKISEELEENELIRPSLGSILCEIPANRNPKELFHGIDWTEAGRITDEASILYKGLSLKLEDAYSAWSEVLDSVFPRQSAHHTHSVLQPKLYLQGSTIKPRQKQLVPRIIIPAFPGTNCEMDSAAAFKRAGGQPKVHLIRNLSPSDIHESIEEFAREIRNSQIIMIPGGFSAGDEPEGSGKFISAVFRNPRVTEAVEDLLENRDGLILGICNGFQALIKLGLLPYGRIQPMESDAPTLTFNSVGRHISSMATTKIISNLSPWLSGVHPGDIHTVPISHGEGRFIASEAVADQLFSSGQVATQYVDHSGKIIDSPEANPNGSLFSIEGISSKDGRILGKMGHSERTGNGVARNIHGEMDQKIFESGIKYFQ